MNTPDAKTLLLATRQAQIMAPLAQAVGELMLGSAKLVMAMQADNDDEKDDALETATQHIGSSLEFLRETLSENKLFLSEMMDMMYKKLAIIERESSSSEELLEIRAIIADLKKLYNHEK